MLLLVGYKSRVSTSLALSLKKQTDKQIQLLWLNTKSSRKGTFHIGTVASSIVG